MTQHALKRVALLVVAFAFITTNASILRGQRATEEAAYGTSNLNPPGTTRLANNLQTSEKTTPNDSRVGKAAVGAINNIIPGGRNLKKRTPFPGTEPKPLASSLSSATAPKFIPPNMGAAAIATTPANGAANSAVTPVSHHDDNRVITRDGNDAAQKASAKQRSQFEVPPFISPNERRTPPKAIGTMFGLYGDSNVERMQKMQANLDDLDRENSELRQQNIALQSRLKETQDQLFAVVREIQSARKELVSARNDLDQLRNDSQILHEKVRVAQKEHTDILQSMGPLLQQLLESDDLGSLPPNPME